MRSVLKYGENKQGSTNTNKMYNYKLLMYNITKTSTAFTQKSDFMEIYCRLITARLCLKLVSLVSSYCVYLHFNPLLTEPSLPHL